MLQPSSSRVTLRRKTAQDRRKFKRIALKKTARCIWADDGREFTAETVDICGGGIALHSNEPYEIGERVIVYIDEIGRLAGEVARPTENGFAVRMKLLPQKLERVVDQLTWLANYSVLGLTDERRHHRRAASGSLVATYENGETAQCTIVDLSVLGVALHTHGPRPEIGSRVQVGQRVGRCARYFEHGFAVEFTAN